MNLSDRTLKRRRPHTVARLVEYAIEEGVQLDLVYADNVRRLSPYEVREYVTGPCLIGWDHVRREYRSFKLGRITGMALVDVPRFEVSE